MYEVNKKIYRGVAFLPYCTSVNMPTTVWKPRRRLNDLQIYDLIMTRELTRSADSSAPSILHLLWPRV